MLASIQLVLRVGCSQRVDSVDYWVSEKCDCGTEAGAVLSAEVA